MREDALKSELRYYELVSEVANTPAGEQLTRHIDVINLKAASVLTHLSIMTGVSVGIFAFWFNKETADRFSRVMFCEILGYIILTLFALVGALITRPRSFAHYDQEVLKRLITIVRFRRNSLLLSIYGTYVLTIVLIVTLAAKMYSEQMH